MTALLTALSIILTRFASVVVGGQLVRLGLGQLPLLAAGLLLGPFWGGVAGLLADLLGVMLNLMGAAFHPGFTLTSILTGALPGLVLVLFKGRLDFRTLLISWLSVFVICTMLLQSLWLSQLQSLPLKTVFLARLSIVPLVQLVNLFLMAAMLPLLRKLPIPKYAGRDKSDS